MVPGSPVATLADVDQPGRRIGVSQGSSSLAALTREFKHAAIVTAPISKEAWHAAGINYPGHTELLGESFASPRSANAKRPSAPVAASVLAAASRPATGDLDGDGRPDQRLCDGRH